VNVFFDNCTAPLLATTLHGFISHSGHSATHIKDVSGLPTGRHSSDLEWISHLHADPGDWIFVTGDGRVLKNSATRRALLSARLHGFVLAPAYQRTPLHQLASTIVWKWPEFEAVTQLLAAPSMHEVPVGRGSKMRALPL